MHKYCAAVKRVRLCEDVCVCVRLCVSFGVFHWGNNSVSAVAHNAVNNVAALSEV